MKKNSDTPACSQSITKSYSSKQIADSCSIKLAPQLLTDKYEVIFDEVLSKVLKCDALVTDWSTLKDFTSCGLSDEVSDKFESFEELAKHWNEWVAIRIKEEFNVSIPNTKILISDLCALILAKRI